MKWLTNCAMLLTVLFAVSCAPKPSFTATKATKQICSSWAMTLIRPSKKDTKETAVGLTRQYNVNGSVCGLILKGK